LLRRRPASGVRGDVLDHGRSGSKVPDAIVDKLNADIRKIATAPEFRKGLLDQGMTPVASTRETATKFIAAEKARWDDVIEKGRISAQ